MTKALIKRNVNVAGYRISGTTAIIGVALLALLLWYLMRRNAMAGTYKNVETWTVKWDPVTMLPLEVEVHRDATRG